MLVHQVDEFFLNLKLCADLIFFELNLIQQYDTSRSTALDSNTNVFYNPNYWLSVFAERQNAIGFEDTLYHDKKHRLWTKFSVVIAGYTNKIYLQVLFPSIKDQSIEPMMFTSLTNSASDSLSFDEHNHVSQSYCLRQKDKLPSLKISELSDAIKMARFREFSHSFILVKKTTLYYVDSHLIPYRVFIEPLQQAAFSAALLAIMGLKNKVMISSHTLNSLIKAHGGTPRLSVTDYFLNYTKDKLYALSSLVARVDRGMPFVIFEKANSLKFRHLLLPELLNIWMKDALRICSLNKVFTSPKQWMKLQLFGLWQSVPGAEIPMPLLYDLVGFIDSYYACLSNQISMDKVKNNLLAWSLGTLNFEQKDVYFLYSQRVRNEPQSETVLEILLNCLININTSAIETLAIWIARQNPAFIAKSQCLQASYELHGYAKAFGVPQLNNYLSRLRPFLSVEGFNACQQLTELLLKKPKISIEVLNLLKIIFKSHDGLNFTRSQTSQNAIIIELAQRLSGAGFCSADYELSDYFQLLFDKLSAVEDPVYFRPVSAYGLDHYIVGDGGKSDLINLYLVHLRKRATGVVMNCNPPGVFCLSNQEVEKISYANARFHYLIPAAKLVLPNQDLLLSTVLMIKNYIEAGCYRNALLLGYEHDKDTMRSVWGVNKTFEAWLKQLAEENREEYKRLINHEIICPSYKTTVGQLLKREDCIATRTFLLASIPIKFTRLKFRDEIEQSCCIGENTIARMRRNISPQHVSDALILSQKSEVLCVFLLTQEFQISLHRDSKRKPSSSSWMRIFSTEDENDFVSFWGFKNEVSPIAKKIFNHLTSKINTLNFSEMYHTVAFILEEIIKPSLKSAAIGEERAWLNAVLSLFLFNQNCTLFTISSDLFVQNKQLYEPIRLLETINSYTVTEKSLSKIKIEFLDELFHTMTQNASDIAKKIRINACFVRFLSKILVEDRDRIIQALNRSAKKTVIGNHKDIYLDYLIERIGINEIEVQALNLSLGRGYSESKSEKSEAYNLPQAIISSLIHLIYSNRIATSQIVFANSKDLEIMIKPVRALSREEKLQGKLKYLTWLLEPIEDIVEAKLNTAVGFMQQWVH